MKYAERNQEDAWKKEGHKLCECGDWNFSHNHSSFSDWLLRRSWCSRCMCPKFKEKL